MKKLLITAAVTLVCVGAFAQGKLAFDIAGNNLMYFTTDTTRLVASDVTATADGLSVALGGDPANAYTIPGSALYTGAGSTIAALSGSPSFIVGLYGGTSSSSLSLQTTADVADVNSTIGGLLSAVNITLASPTFPAGTPAWFQVQVYDSRNSSAADAWGMTDRYAGESMLFQATPLASVYGPLYQTAAPVNSGWTAGTFHIKDLSGEYGDGADGTIGGIAVYATISSVPEPGTFALAGLGLAALLVFRRRK